MIAMPHSAEDFYAARDNRTNRYSGVAPQYTTVKVLVTAESAHLNALAGQVALLVSLNLLSRWCRQVWLEFEDVPRLATLGGG